MIKIAIIGPESTGKSELAKNLASHYNTIWIPEYAREYIEGLQTPYTYQDVCNIALKQIELEKKYENDSSDNLIFFDTELIITKVWFDYCYKKIPDFVSERLNTGYFDFYLLCSPDLPWEPDPVREHGHDRDFFFNWYLTEIEQTKKPYVIICDKGNKRIENAINAIENFLQKHLTEQKNA